MNRLILPLFCLLAASACAPEVLDLNSGREEIVEPAPSTSATVQPEPSSSAPGVPANDSSTSEEEAKTDEGFTPPPDPDDSGATRPKPWQNFTNGDAGYPWPDLPRCLPEAPYCSGKYSICDSSRGQCVECQTSLQCNRGSYCDTWAGVCRDGCASDDDCLGDEKNRCERHRGHGHCVQCLRHDDCVAEFGASRSVCDGRDHACRPCESNRECPPGSECNSGTCVFD